MKVNRATGLFLLALGLFFLTVAGICGGLWLMEPHRGDVSFVLLAIAVAMALAGVLALVFASRLMRDTRPWYKPSPPAEVPGGYLADQPQTRQRGDREFHIHYTAAKPKVPSNLVVQFAAKSPVPIQFNEENWFDTLCKSWGIAQEVQTKDRAFDSAVYVRCPSDGFARRYLADPARRAAVLALRQIGFTQIQLTGTHVVAHWPHFDPAARPDAADAAMEHLEVLAEGVPSSDPDRVAARTNGRLIACAFLWMFVIGLAVTLPFAFVYPPVRVTSLLAVSAATFFTLYVLFAWLAARWLHGESVSHDRWAALVGVGFPLLALGSAGAVSGVNALADRSGPEVRTATVMSKRATKSKNSYNYHATVPDWSGGQIECRVSKSEYDAIVLGRSRMELTTGRGALGIEWLRSKQVLTGP